MFNDFDEKTKFPQGFVILFFTEKVQEYNPYYPREGGQEYFTNTVLRHQLIGIDVLAERVLKLQNTNTPYRISKFIPMSATIETSLKFDLI